MTPASDSAEYLRDQARRAQMLQARAHRNAAFCVRWGLKAFAAHQQREAAKQHLRARVFMWLADGVTE